MDRRRYLAGCVGVASLVAGCFGEKTNAATPEGDTNATDADASESARERRLGRWGRVTERTATAPTEVRFADRIVFRTFDDDELVWTPNGGTQFCLVTIGLSVTDAPEGELVVHPNPLEYRLRANERTYRPRPRPAGTSVIVEPIRSGYASRGSKGAEGTISWGGLAFEIPADLPTAALRIEYTDDVNGDALIWAPGTAFEP